MPVSSVVRTTSVWVGSFLRDLAHFVEGPVEEVIRAVGPAAIDHGSRIAACADNLALSHQAALDEVAQHHIGTGAGGRQVDMRSVFGGRLEQACEHGGFSKIDVLDALAEVELRSGSDAECAAAHIGAVEIRLQDFLLVQIGFEPDGEEGFLDLAVDAALIGEEQVFRQLLR